MIIELSGLPHSGKSSIAKVLRSCLSRAGYSVRVVAENTHVCPFSTKNRVEFAYWAAHYSVNVLLENRLVPTSEITILDRGFFDALMFIYLLQLENYISNQQAVASINYFCSQSWSKYIDLVLFLSIPVKLSLERDLATSLCACSGHVLNQETLTKMQDAYRFIMENFGCKFNVKIIDVKEITEAFSLAIDSLAELDTNGNDRSGFRLICPD